MKAGEEGHDVSTMGGAATGEGRSLEFTPTWTVATLCTVFILLSFTVERSIDTLRNYLCRTQRNALLAALEKMKDELMLLGFMSLAITVLGEPVSRICISTSLYDRLVPCSLVEKAAKANSTTGSSQSTLAHGRLLQVAISEGSHGRTLVGASASTSMCPEGKEPFVSTTSLNQLHIFIFVMAVVHLLYSALTMLLALVKVHGWKEWEAETQTLPHENDNFAEMIKNITYSRQSTFVRYHTSKPWSRSRFLVWVVCFFRQFWSSVTHADYVTLRLGFITNHNTGLNYNFHSYMIRCMEDEFKSIVGISAPLWGFVVIFLLLNVKGSNLYFWISFVPVVLLLVVGVKLQHVIATLALENAGVQGPSVGAELRPRNELFWFNRPKILLTLIHFILFQNAFELATFIWFWWQFTLKSCFLDSTIFVYTRLAVGLAAQVFCSFSTLPLYALVSQMGTHHKKAIFPTHVNDAIQGWRKTAKRRVRHGPVMHSHDVSHRSHDDFPTDKIPIRYNDSLGFTQASKIFTPLDLPQNILLEEGSYLRGNSLPGHRRTTLQEDARRQNVWERRTASYRNDWLASQNVVDRSKGLLTKPHSMPEPSPNLLALRRRPPPTPVAQDGTLHPLATPTVDRLTPREIVKEQTE